MAESSNANTAVSGLKTSTEEISSEDSQSSRRDSSSGTSGNNTTPSQPDLPPSASKKRSAPEPAASHALPRAEQGGLRTKSRCIKRARKATQTSSSDQEISNTDDASNGEVEEVVMPSTTLDLATSKSGADKATTLAKPSAETQEPIASSSAAPMVLGEMTEGAEGEKRKSHCGLDHGRRDPRPGRATALGAPPFRLLFFAYSFVPKPKPRRGPHEGYSRLCGRRTPERKELSGGQESAGKFLPEGEIDAIAIVIERDIISIIIIIISTIYTAITTAAPRHRCSNSGISMNEVRKKLFTISLSGKAAHWYKLLKNGDSIDWEDIVPLFYSKFYPPSEIHKDRNRIYNFPHDGESIAQAWGRLKSLMLKCPIHELPGNVIIDNFYARLSFQDKTLLDTSCSGSFTRKNEEFKRDLLDRIQENTEGWENDKDRESVKDLVTENVEDGHIIFCEDASNIVSHPNKSKQVSVPMLSVRIGDHCYYGLCDIGASVSAIPYELYTEIMHEIGSCELEDIDVVIHLANRETISPIGIVRDVEVLCGSSSALDLDSFPCAEEAIRVADEFCDQYRALRREVEILQEENQRLRRMLEYYSNPTRPSPPHSGNNESLQVLVSCKIEKLKKLKEILMKREKNPSPPSPKE
ncbi:hypothetical protein QYE76_028896 [Lolium multiflorum]|uniref:Retrotransposon gag domain-containing protein n=1 Tax=Lolium multiflorum TaxID=4521 RepID=A0AAD8VHR7_LOLMU|nr:hypothetical protein QYE76_028896 [Lolium multiflorum]